MRESGGGLRRPTVTQRLFQPLITKAKVPLIRFHDLRHTSATILLLGNVHPKIVSERLGHASIEIVEHVQPRAADAAKRCGGETGWDCPRDRLPNLPVAKSA